MDYMGPSVPSCLLAICEKSIHCNFIASWTTSNTRSDFQKRENVCSVLSYSASIVHHALNKHPESLCRCVCGCVCVYVCVYVCMCVCVCVCVYVCVSEYKTGSVSNSEWHYLESIHVSQYLFLRRVFLHKILVHLRPFTLGLEMTLIV